MISGCDELILVYNEGDMTELESDELIPVYNECDEDDMR